MRMAELHADQEARRKEQEDDDYLAYIEEQRRITEQLNRVSKATASTH